MNLTKIYSKLLPFFIFTLISCKLFADNIIVDASKYSGKNLKKKFQMMQTGYTTTNDYKMHFGRLSDIKCTNIRIDHIWDLHDILTGTYPNFNYNWSLLDQKVEQIEQEGTIPYICLSYTPSVLGQSYSPPNNMIAWKEICKQLVLHLKNKGYNINYFEVWNEPDIDIFWTGTQQEYFELYKYAVDGVLEADPTAKVGGPSIAGNTSWITSFLDFCVSNSIQVDFVSFHNFTWDVDSTKNLINIIQDIINAHPNLGELEIHLGEWNNEVDSYSGYDGDKAKGAAWLFFAIKKLLEFDNLTLVQRAQYIDIGGSDVWGNLGVVEENGGAPKAVYNAYKIYAMVPEQRLFLENTGTIDGMASRSSDTVAVILWNYSDSSKNINLTINNIALTNTTYEKFIIDRNHSSYWDNPSTNELEKVAFYGIADTATYSEEIKMGPYSSYLILLIRTSPNTNVRNNNVQMPDGFRLEQNFPNPFNPSTSISFHVPSRAFISLKIFDILGRELSLLISEELCAGDHSVHWNASGLPGGTYFYRLQSGSFSETKKLILLK